MCADRSADRRARVCGTAAARARTNRRSVPWSTRSRQFDVRRKCRLVKGFPRREALDGETLPAAALALHVRVAEAESLVQSLLDEIHGRAIQEAQAACFDEDLHAPVLEHDITRLRFVRVIDDVGEP